MRHHPVLDPFEPLQVDLGDDWDVNFLGVRTRRMFWIGGDQPRQDAGNLPRPDEEYIEWIDVLEAVSNARDRFTMVELGAGWARWLVNAVAALRHRPVNRPAQGRSFGSFGDRGWTLMPSAVRERFDANASVGRFAAARPSR
ncbi:MAG: hypothetical protein H0U16_02480 [Actinobacteria bacterium]|nr:hypothetical protein [Actinomycetota bacterium]